MKFLKFIILSATSFAAITFALSNRDNVAVGFFPFTYQVKMPLFLIMFTAFILGIMIGGASSVMHNLKLRRVSRSTKKQVKKLEKELTVLKEKTETVNTI